MTGWHKHYQPPQADCWHGRGDSEPGERLFQVVHCVNWQQKNPPIKAGYGLIGFCCDAGITRNGGRAGAKAGPAALRKMLGNLTVHNHGMHFYDFGDIVCDDDDLEGAQQSLTELVQEVRKVDILPIVIGGGHEVAFGHYRGHAQLYQSQSIGIINFDAHFDVRPLLANDKGSSGTPFLQIANMNKREGREFGYMCVGIQPSANTASLYATAKSLHTRIIEAPVLHTQSLNTFIGDINAFTMRFPRVYLSICLDAFSSSIAPGVSAPQIDGLNLYQVIPFVKRILRSGKVVGVDIAELSPQLDDLAGSTAKLAAQIVWHILHPNLAS